MKETKNKATLDTWEPLFFAAIAAAVWGPALFMNGFVLLSDMVFTPSMHPPNSLLGPVTGTMNVTLVYSLAWVLARILGAVLLQKTLLFLMAFLSGYLMYRNVPCRTRWARFFAGTLYAVNPFVYTRMLMGQWGLVLGYCLLPVALASTLNTVKEPSAGRCARTSLWLAGIVVLNLSMGAIAVLVCLVAGIFELASRQRAKQAALALGVVLLLFLLLSAFWLLPALKGGDLTGAINKSDLEVFTTRSTSRAGTWLSVAGLYGYWKTAIDNLLPRNYVPLWPLFALGIVLLSLLGFWSYRREPTRGPLVKALLVIGALGFLLALGTRAPITGPAFSFAYNHFPPFRIFREPQKFAAMLALAYSMLGGLGVERLVSRQHRGAALPGTASASARPNRSWRVWLLPALLILSVFFYSFRMFGGLWGKAKAVSYPHSWAQAQESLNSDRGDWRVLYLPPYWYMRFDFAKSEQTITSPMPYYFTNRYVQLNALLVGGMPIDRQPVDKYISAVLETARERGNLGALLAPLNIKYVLMPLNIASSHFRFVEEQKDLEVVKRWSNLVLLRNKVPVSPLTLVRSTGSYTTFEAVGKEANGGNLLGSFLPRGTKTVVPPATGTPLPHEDSRTGTVTAMLPHSRGGSSSVLFSELYSADWRASVGGAAKKQLGVVNAFQLPEGASGKIKISYFNFFVVLGYFVSATVLLLCLLFVTREALTVLRKKNAWEGMD